MENMFPDMQEEETLDEKLDGIKEGQSALYLVVEEMRRESEDRRWLYWYIALGITALLWKVF